MSKYKKRISLLLTLIITLSLIGIKIVNAATISDVVYVDKSFTFQVATTPFNNPNKNVIGRENPIRRRSDGQLVYCLQSHVELISGSPVLGYDDDENQAILSGLSFEDRQRIFNIAYYGYGYGNHTSMDWYAATQIMIWQVADKNNNPPYPIEDEDTTLAYSNKYDSMFDEINYLVDHDYLTVSFNNQNVEANVGDTVTFTDDNGVLDKFFTVHAENIDAKIQANQLVVTSNKKFDGTITLTPNTNVKPLIYDGANQKVVSRGDPRKVQAKVKIRFKGGDIETYKKDIDTKLSTPQGEATLLGALYDVYDAESDEIVATITTDENGYAKSGELPKIGRYYLKEKKPSNGYQLDDTKYYFDITANNLHPSIEVYEKIINLDFDITKVYANDDKSEIMLPEADVQFGFYDNKGNLYKTAITDKNGNIKINLVYGTYTVKQLTTSKDHEKVKDFVLKVEKVGEEVRMVISNAEIKAKLRVVKIDKETGKVISKRGIKFKIYNVDKNEYVCQNVTYPQKDKICVFETNDKGEFITPNVLESARYQLEEQEQVIDGYLWNNKSEEFEIGENSKLINDEEYGVVFETEFGNQPVKGKVTVHKDGERVELSESDGFIYSFDSLKGIKYGLFANEDIYFNNELIYEKNQFVAEQITDEKGNLVFEDLVLGKYYLKELETKNDYILDTKKYEFELKYKDPYTKIIEYKMTFKNYLPTGKLDFTKTDISDGTPLPNTKIEIYTENNNLVFNGRTDENGKIVIDKLPLGKYYILEKEAPDGYLLNDEKMWFEIQENNQVVKAVMTDEKNIVDVPNTFASDNHIIEKIASLLIIFGIGVFLYGNRKK